MEGTLNEDLIDGGLADQARVVCVWLGCPVGSVCQCSVGWCGVLDVEGSRLRLFVVFLVILLLLFFALSVVGVREVDCSSPGPTRGAAATASSWCVPTVPDDAAGCTPSACTRISGGLLLGGSVGQSRAKWPFW